MRPDNYVMSEADKIIEEWGKPPKFIKYNYKNSMMFGKIIDYHYEAHIGRFILTLHLTKKTESTHLISWPPVSRKHAWDHLKKLALETITEEEYLASLVLES